jgi:hypothetical protein
MKKSNVATKLAPAKTPARAKVLSPRDRQLAAQAEVARKAEAKRLAHNAQVREYLRKKRAAKKAERARGAQAAQVAKPAPMVAITKQQLIATLEVQIIAARASAPADSAMLAALETSLRLARLLA